MSTSPEPTALKKRKRTTTAPDNEEELEIDVSAPEPPSKKALRRAKKGKSAVPTETADTTLDAAFTETPPSNAVYGTEPPKRSDHGIWIGNLPFTVDKAALLEFLQTADAITDAAITRVNMPVPAGGDGGRRLKPQNKGFAYVDFDSAEAKDAAVGLSEQLLMGRRVLIKDSKSYAGRPEKGAGPTAAALSGVPVPAAEGAVQAKEKSKRVFVGNLGFDVSRDELEEHFAQAGPVEDVFVATFEDTGKCKGYAWVRFETEEAAEGAVRGFVFKDIEDDDEDDEGSVKEEDGEEKKKAKKKQKRKWFVNRLNGRSLRCEFAEDPKTRYNKRFGKGAAARQGQRDGEGAVAEGGAPIREVEGRSERPKRTRMQGDKDQRQEQRRQRHVDARNVAPGAALSNAPRASAAMVESQGKKIKFDE